jgi:maleylacetate reductase
MVFTGMDRVLFGVPAADAVLAEAQRLKARRVFLLASGTLNRETEIVSGIDRALGDRFAGVYDAMPAHAPREAVVACAEQLAMPRRI